MPEPGPHIVIRQRDKIPGEKICVEVLKAYRVVACGRGARLDVRRDAGLEPWGYLFSDVDVAPLEREPVVFSLCGAAGMTG